MSAPRNIRGKLTSSEDQCLKRATQPDSITGRLPDFIFLRRPDIELEGFLLAGLLVTDILTDIRHMTGPSGHLAGSVTALRGFLQSWHCHADAGCLADRGSIAV